MIKISQKWSPYEIPHVSIIPFHHVCEYYPGYWIFLFLPKFSDNYRYILITIFVNTSDIFRFQFLILVIFSDIYRYFPISTEISPQMVPIFTDIFRFQSPQIVAMFSDICRYFPASTDAVGISRYLPIFPDFNLYKCCR